MIKKIVVKAILTVAGKVFNWATDKAFDILDKNDNGTIEAEEFKWQLYQVAVVIDEKSRHLRTRLQK